MQDQDRFEVEYLPDGKPNFFKGKGVSSAFYYFALDSKGERWLVKGMLYDPQGEEAALLQVVQSDIAKERLANQLYAQFGIPVARLATAWLPGHFLEGEEFRQHLIEKKGLNPLVAKGTNTFKEMYDKFKLEAVPCLLSRFLDHFNNYGYLPDLKIDKPYFELLIDDQPFPEVGLGRVLAVTQWIRDIDAIGGSGANVGYRLRQHPDGGLLVETCKIDPGGAFFEFEKIDSNEVNPVIQLAQQGEQEIYTQWQDWPPQTQAEYWETIRAIIDLPEKKLIEIFETTDPQKHYQDYDLCLTRLKTRQAHLRVLYQEYEDTIQNKPQKVIELPNLTLMQSDNPIVRLETNQQLILSSNSVQQAFHFYIKPFVLIDANLSLDTRRNWAEELIHFMENPQKKSLLLLGPAGAGKSIESYRCLKKAHKLGYIPLRIELKRFTENTVGQCVINTLKDDYQLSDPQIEQLKTQRMLFILDGYDEIAGRPRINLYDSNNLSEWKNSKVLITCRSQYFTYEMRTDFIPNGNAQALQEWHLAPLSDNQIQDYLSRYQKDHPEFDLQTCLDYLHQHEETKALLDTPLMLKLLVEAWPYLKQKNQRLTRYDLYEAFFKSWEALQEERTIQQLGHYEKLIEHFQFFSEDLAWELYVHAQESVDYENDDIHSIWHRFFTDQNSEVVKARLGCPLTRKETQYSFIHKSFADHLVARQLWKSLTKDAFEICLQKWNRRFLVDERAILEFLAEMLEGLSSTAPVVEKLFELIEASKNNPEVSKAASNAISVLNKGNKMLIRKNFSHIHIPCADLSFSCCVGSDFSNADLTKVNFRGADCRDAHFENTIMSALILGEQAYWEFDSEVECMAYSPDGQWLAVAVGKNIKLQDVQTGQTVRTFEAHQGRFTSVAFSPSSLQLATGSDDKTVYLWDVERGVTTHIFEGHHDSVNSVAISPWGEWLASADDKNLVVWDAKTGGAKYTFQHFPGSVMSIAFSPLEEQLAFGCGNSTVGLVDIKTGIIRCFKGKSFGANRELIIAFSPSGKQIVASGGFDHAVYLWDVETGTVKHIFKGHKHFVNTVAFSPSGKRIASGSQDKTVCLWDVETGDEIHVFKGHTDTVRSVVFAPSGVLASGGRDRTVRLWDSEMIFTNGHKNPITRWNTKQPIETNTLTLNFSPHERSRVVFSTSGQQMASINIMDYSIHLWEIETGITKYTLKGHESEITSVVFSPSSKLIVSGSEDGAIRVWDVETGIEIRNFKDDKPEAILSVAFSASGDYIASGSRDGTVSLWDIEKGIKTYTCPLEKEVTSLIFSPSSEQLVFGCENSTVGILDIKTGVIRTFVKKESTNNFIAKDKNTYHHFISKEVSVALSPSAMEIAASLDENIVRLWNIETGIETHTFKGHEHKVTSMAFSPYGKWLASGSIDKTVRLWDIETGRCAQIIESCWVVDSVAFNSKTNQLAIGTGSTIQCFELNEQGLYQLLFSLPSSEALQLKGCYIQSASGLLRNNRKVFEQRGARGTPFVKDLSDEGLYSSLSNSISDNPLLVNITHLPVSQEIMRNSILLPRAESVIQGVNLKGANFLGDMRNICITKFDVQHSVMGIYYAKLGEVYREKGEFERAIKYYEKGLEIILADFGEEHPDLATIYNNLGAAYFEQDHFVLAIEYVHKSLTIDLKVLGEHHPNVARSYYNLAEAYRMQGNFKKAIEYFEKSLFIRLEELGENHPNMEVYYTNLGETYRQQGQFECAIKYYKKSLDVCLSNPYRNEPQVATIYNNLGAVYFAQANYARAIESIEKSLAIDLKVLGEHHLNVARSYYNLAETYRMQRNFKQAIEYFEKSLLIRLEELDENNPSMEVYYTNLGEAYREQGQFECAIKYYKKSLDVCLFNPYRDELKVATIYNNLGAAYFAQTNYSCAIECLHKSLSIRLLRLDEQHTDVGTSYENLAEAYIRQGQFSDAIICQNKALEIWLSNFGEHHPKVKLSYDYLNIMLHQKQIKDKNRYQLDKKIKIHDSSLISLLKVKISPHFFGVRDEVYKVDAVVEISTEEDKKTAALLQKQLNGYGNFFEFNAENSLRKGFVLEGINMPSENKDPSLGTKLQDYLLKIKKREVTGNSVQIQKENDIQIKEVLEDPNEIKLQKTFHQRIETIAKTLNLTLNLENSSDFFKASNKLHKKAACFLAELILSCANMTCPQTQAEFYQPKDSNRLCLEVTFTEMEQCQQFFEIFTSYYLSAEFSEPWRLKVIFDADVFESVLLPMLVEKYQKQPSLNQEKRNDRCLVT